MLSSGEVPFAMAASAVVMTSRQLDQQGQHSRGEVLLALLAGRAGQNCTY